MLRKEIKRPQRQRGGKAREKSEQHKVCARAKKAASKRRSRRIHRVVRAAREIAPSSLSSLRNKTISLSQFTPSRSAPQRGTRRALRARQFIADNSIATWVTTSRSLLASTLFFSLSSPIARLYENPSFFFFSLLPPCL